MFRTNVFPTNIRPQPSMTYTTSGKCFSTTVQWIVRRNYEIGGSFATRFIDNWHDTGWETSHNLGRSVLALDVGILYHGTGSLS